MPLRRVYIDQALTSFDGLKGVLLKMTEAEVLACLDLEAGTRRRRSVIDRLISRAVRLHEVSYSNHLKEKYHATSLVQDHEPV